MDGVTDDSFFSHSYFGGIPLAIFMSVASDTSRQCFLFFSRKSDEESKGDNFFSRAKGNKFENERSLEIEL
ncbi:hypothetical protein JTE90_006074 [Oedothorax gibbosus]|uniref:Uncharacterized protein n=1 Tax=Oedothorax gibbosus TaxID=931172 RepID=A0AAV6V6M9_9ARAC|nr:hypothetical protein JTE90_006074 [Oedothorax gibbosus]